MTQPKNANLWNGISNFQLDVPGDELTFSQRLARDNGWSLSYARRVIEEYKKFVYLTMTVGHVVTPSEQVDEAWHLHLLYTESYWNQFCAKVLGEPLHHIPTRGGSGEHEKHRQQYLQTLESYAKNFGTPPDDIWPSVAQAFSLTEKRAGKAGSVIKSQLKELFHPRQVGKKFRELYQNFMQKGSSRYLFLAMFAVLWLDSSVVQAAQQKGWNPFDWRGPEFLQFQFALIAAMLLLAIGIRFYFYRSSPGWNGAGKVELDQYVTSFLSGGNRRAVQSAMMTMITRGHLRFDELTKSFVPELALPDDAADLEQEIYEAAGRDGKFKKIWEATEPERLKIYESLQGQSLIFSDAEAMRTRLISGLIMAIPLCTAIGKIIVGVSRGKPVEVLVVTVVVSVILMVIMFIKKPFLTRKGWSVLRSAQREYESLRTQTITPGTDPLLTGMLLGLFGSTVLAGTPWEGTQKHVFGEMQSSGSGSGCSSGCGGSSCGGGGGCGGGCGGCGGGD